MKIFVTVLFLLQLGILNAQYYNSSVGLRTGSYGGFFGSKYINDKQMLEFMVNGRENGMQLTGLVKTMKPVYPTSRGLVYVYYGYGTHAGFVQRPSNKNYRNVTIYDDNVQLRPLFGADLNAGVEFLFDNYPISMALDAKPMVELFGNRIFYSRFMDLQFIIRFHFNYETIHFKK